jgi:hypothetical protein
MTTVAELGDPSRGPGSLLRAVSPRVTRCGERHPDGTTRGSSQPGQLCSSCDARRASFKNSKRSRQVLVDGAGLDARLARRQAQAWGATGSTSWCTRHGLAGPSRACRGVEPSELAALTARRTSFGVTGRDSLPCSRPPCNGARYRPHLRAVQQLSMARKNFPSAGARCAVRVKPATCATVKRSRSPSAA